MSIGFAAPASAATPEELVPDAAFRTCLDGEITAAGLSGGITEANLAALTVVNCYSLGITSAEGAQWLTSAQYLGLADNALTAMPSLSALTQLSGISLSNNALTDLNFLAGMALPVSLYWDFSHNALGDVSALAGMPLPDYTNGGSLEVLLNDNELADDDLPGLTALGTSLEAVGFGSEQFSGHFSFGLDGNRFRDLSSMSGFTFAGVSTRGNYVGAACQSVDLGQLAAGASVPLKLRDVRGGTPEVFAQENTGQCAAMPPANAAFVGALPAGISWDGDVLVADPSLIGQTITFLAASTGQPISLDRQPGTFTVTFTVVAPPVTPTPEPTPAPAPAPSDPAVALAKTGVPTGSVEFGLAAAASGLLLGAVLFAVRKRNVERTRRPTSQR